MQFTFREALAIGITRKKRLLEADLADGFQGEREHDGGVAAVAEDRGVAPREQHVENGALVLVFRVYVDAIHLAGLEVAARIAGQAVAAPLGSDAGADFIARGKEA